MASIAPLPLIIAATPLAIVKAVFPRAAIPEDLFPFFSNAITDILSPPFLVCFIVTLLYTIRIIIFNRAILRAK
ncbi:hypothetical protein NCCP133_21180 [Cytobacillus sp. NCCP-133]|nr:hypothetical protein NCCP133_21180 [Cytobacillus sp. NCCP-133]